MAFGACMAVAFGLQIAHSFGRPWRWPLISRITSMTALAAVVLAPALWIGPQAAAIVPLLAASILLVVPVPYRWLLYGLACVVNPVLYFVQGLGIVNIIFVFVFTLVQGLVFYGLSFLAELAEELEGGRSSLGRIAAAGERVRIARDLHDVVGHDLLAFTLKSELAHRLLPASPERAEGVMSEALWIARRATAALRTIPMGCQKLSLAGEVRSIESTLSVAQIEVRMSVSCRDLPEIADSVLAIVLREAITNVLRHSKARQCEVDGGVRDGLAWLSVANDGVNSDAVSSDGSGLENLSSRLAAVGGRLTVTREDGWFRLLAEIRLSDVPAGAPAPPSDAGGGKPAELLRQSSVRWAPGTVNLLTLAVLLGYIPILITNILWRNPAGFTWGVGICLAVLLITQLAHTFFGPRVWPTPVRMTTLSIQAVASFLPMVWVGTLWGSMGGFLAGSIPLVVRGRRRWALYAAVGGVVLALDVAGGDETTLLGYLVISTLQTGLVIYGLTSLSALVAELHATRKEIVRLAVEQERLGVARKVNELLDRDLSTIMWNCGVARGLTLTEPERAQEHIMEVLVAARRLVAEVRSTASGYRHVSLAAEVDSTRAALSAAGIEAQVDIACARLAEEADVVLAMVLRDAITGMVRRSGVRRCVVTVTRENGYVRLRVSHDRATATPREEGRLRLRLSRDRTSLSESDEDRLEQVRARLDAVNGDLRTETTGEWFHLTAELPSDVMAGPRPVGEGAA
ncbi:sensor histidine kinase [Nonomuraea sp. NPDC049400]|uniref:sensor histidine kinase n=1 Tax=Nonomuraea sp. NPDC049400 TaxID=3364352 RepID=UPI0037913A13